MGPPAGWAALEPEAKGACVSYRGGSADVWYVNSREGLEQGFTLRERPAGFAVDEPVTLSLPIETGLEARAGGDGNSVVFADAEGEVRLEYASLYAFDADGDRVPATMRLEAERGIITLALDDRGAAYPLVVDPVLVTRLGKLTADPPTTWEFGQSLALYGGTLAVADPYGSKVHIFERDPLGYDQWRQAASLTETNVTPYNQQAHGKALALEGGTLAVGSSGRTAPAVYIHERNLGGAGAWGVSAVVTASFPVDRFGHALAMDGDRLAVGGWGASVFLYERDAGGPGRWGEVARIDGSTVSADADAFGYSVALAGNTLVVGDPEDGRYFIGRAYVFGRNQGGPGRWGLLADLQIPSNPNQAEAFGHAVAISADESTIAVSSTDTGDSATDGRPRLSVYGRDVGGPGAWGLIKTFMARDTQDANELGSAIALDETGELLFAGDMRAPAPTERAGVLYIFGRDEGGVDNWGEVAKLAAQDGPRTSGVFGAAVAYDRGVLAVGDPLADMDATNNRSGAAYLFRNGSREGTWTPAAQPAPGAQDPGERLGQAVAVAGDFLVAGAPDGVGAGGRKTGVAYLFRRSGNLPDAWDLIRTLTPASLENGARFGSSVALDDEWLVVGAPGQTVSDLADAGSVYVYQRNRHGVDNWGLLGYGNAPNPAGGGEYGASVALDHDRLFVGAPGEGSGGRCHILERNTGGADAWQRVQLLNNPNASSGDRFGGALAADENRLLVGAPGTAGLSSLSNALVNAGRAYVYDNPGGGGFRLTQSLPVPGVNGSFGKAGARYGASVSIEDDFALVGAPGETSGAMVTGAAYVHARNQGGADTWDNEARLRSAAPAAGADFGGSVWLHNDRAYVGAPGFELNGIASGAVAVFERNEGGSAAWGATDVIMPRDGTAGDRFGAVVAAEGSTLVAGRPGRDGDRGAVETYRRRNSVWMRVAQHEGSAGTSGDLFGAAIALDGETLVVGAADPGITSVVATDTLNAAYVFKKNRNGEDAWGEVCKLLPLDNVNDSSFGASVGVSGDQVIVGAYRADVAGVNQGAAYVFARNEGGLNHWGQTQKLTGTPASDLAAFGYDVSLDGNWAAVSSPRAAHGAFAESGRVTIYKRQEGGADHWGKVAEILPGDPADHLFFGRSIALDGDQLLVGAPRLSFADLSYGEGRAYLFARNEGGADQWGEVARLVGHVHAPTFDAEFGREVALDGDVGAITGGSTTGDTWVYLIGRNGGGADAWGFTGLLTNRTEDAFDDYGYALALEGDVLAIGAPNRDGLGTNTFSGAVYLYLRNPDDSAGWSLQRTFEPWDAAAWDHFGASVAVSGGILAMGSDKRSHADPAPAGEIYVHALERDDYESWARQTFGDATVSDEGLEADTWGPDANPDGDAHPNLVEAYLDTHPQFSNSIELICGAYVDAETGEVAMQWARGKEHQDIVAEVQWSPDLRTWYLAGTGPTGLTPPRIGVGTVGIFSDKRDLLEARIDTTGISRAFLRLRLRKQ